MTLDEKIEIFNRFTETQKEKIVGKTVFEGYPIGQWAIQLRNQINNQQRKLPDEQREKLEKLGILDRQIDSTIDEKIDAIIEWNRRHPKMKVGTKISEKEIPEDLEYEYERLCKYNEYIKQRNYRGKLTKLQKDKWQEENEVAILGNSMQKEELAKKYRISTEKIDYILLKYNSMEEFIEKYRTR